MTQLRIKLLAASVAALAAADTGSAQIFRSNTARGIVSGVGAVTGTGSPYGYGNGYGTPYGGYGYNTGYGSSYYHNGVYNTSPQFGGWNAQAYNNGFGQQTYVTPNGTYYTTPATGMVQAGGYTNGTTPGVVTANEFVTPQQMTGGVTQTGAMMMPQAMSSGQTVTTQVLAPDGANVTLSGVSADRTQGARPFVSPPLDPNKTYTYRAKATWVDPNGKAMTREKNVDVRAGQQVTIDLTTADQNRSPDHSD